MSNPEAPLYDHAQDLELEIERPLPDWGGDEVFAATPRRRFARVEAPRPVPAPASPRRTVVITGRPLDHRRPRPPRTVEDRLGSRPDRIAGWAFALGIGLVLAAVATADAAPL